MSEPLEREWRFYVEDMVGFCSKVLSYTQDLDASSFAGSGIHYDATLRNIELVGEAATHIPEKIRRAHPEIAWRKIIATRNRLIHGYLGIDNDVLWSIVQSDIPQLLEQLRILQSQGETSRLQPAGSSNT
jgi:uncharacterized protein with HEPN domain